MNQSRSIWVDGIPEQVPEVAASLCQNRLLIAVEGIFDNKKQQVYDARVIQAGSVDIKIKQAHSNGRKEVAFWQ